MKTGHSRDILPSQLLRLLLLPNTTKIKHVPANLNDIIMQNKYLKKYNPSFGHLFMTSGLEMKKGSFLLTRAN